MRDGFIKIAAATPDLHVADCAYNTSEIVKLAKKAAAKGAKLGLPRDRRACGCHRSRSAAARARQAV